MKTVKFGSVGLGRLGHEHARNLAALIPGCELTAICDIDPKQVQAVAEELGVARTYSDFEALCADPEVDAVAIVSPSFLHVGQIEIAMAHGKHVFCEKPLGVNVAECKAAEKIVEAHPELVFQLGFMRRFDKSYAEAKRRVDRGDIGQVVLVRSYTQDPRATIESTLKFAPHSGGQFLDMCVHDLDLLRWFTGSELKNVWAMGGVFEFELYRELNDADNAAAAIQCENGAMGFLFTNRTHAAGSNVETEIIGTRGTLRIANVGAKDLLQIVDEHGARQEYYPDFMTRWHDAFTAELSAFADHVRKGTRPADLTVYDGTAASEAAYRCKESFETGKMLPI
ncbi:MAG: Gfo/Idh/MocA family oxidoreductase, partial [Oscillibacter sp.]